MTGRLFRFAVVLILVALLAGGTPMYGQAKQAKQGPDYSKGQPSFPNLLRPYGPLRVPEPALANSPRIEQLIQNGKLMLSLQDAITLALENNLDIAVQRYTPWIADTDLLRTKGGGATRGLAGTGTAQVLGAIPSPSFDPVVTSTLGWDRRSFPINNPFLAGTGLALPGITNYTGQANFQYSQGFHTGTAYAIAFNNNRQSTTSPGSFLNPSVSSSLFFSFSQQLLNGFGFLPNTRFIRIAKNSRKIADLVFAQQVITTVSQVENLYWELVFSREDVKVKQRSVELAEKLYHDNKRQVEIGTLAPIEVVRAEAEVARTRQDLIVSQTFLLQQQTLLKNAISKNPMDLPLRDVEVVPTDVIVKPPQAEVIPIQDAVKEAWEKRPETRQSQIDLENREISVRATRNALLPTLTLLGQYGSAGLAGDARNLSSTTVVGAPVVDANGNPVPNLFVPASRTTVVSTTQKGWSEALETVYNNDFPTYSVQLSLSIPIKNRSAQADSARALLEQRQAETRLRQLQNSIVVEVRNAQIALEQNRARVEAAQKARELADRTLDAEQKKYQLGASTIFFVIQAQRDLAAAQSVELRALVDLQEARVSFDRALGRTLEVNKIDIADAKSGQVERSPLIPGTPSGELAGASGTY